MSTRPIDRYLARYPTVSALIYGSAVLVLLLTCGFALSDIGRQYQELGAAREVLSSFEARTTNSEANRAAISQPPGVPFLDGPTVTVASASLLQRMTSAITRVGGTVVSSEIDNHYEQSKDGYVRISATCNLEQNALQQLLYDIESGMPFLFIDQLSAQAELQGKKDGQMRVSLGVTGLWREAK